MKSVNWGGQKPCQTLQISESNRVDFVDLIKGLVITLVVWVHTTHFDWLDPTLVNSTFFFLSGIFFKPAPFREFVGKKARTLLIPFVSFYILCIPFIFVRHYWSNRTFDDFDYSVLSQIFELFSLRPADANLDVDGPLWFLGCLFIIQIYYYFVSKLPRAVVFVIAVAVLLSKNVWLHLPSPFWTSNAVYWLGYFALGNLSGPALISALSEKRNRLIALGISAGLCVYFYFYHNLGLAEEESVVESLFSALYYCSIFFVLFAISSWFNGKKWLQPLRYLGNNTLIILVTHMHVLYVVSSAGHKLLQTTSPWLGLVYVVLTLLILVPIIEFINRKMPFLLGKRNKKT